MPSRKRRARRSVIRTKEKQHGVDRVDGTENRDAQQQGNSFNVLNNNAMKRIKARTGGREGGRNRRLKKKSFLSFMPNFYKLKGK